MAGRLRGDRGGIVGLLDLYEDHPEAVEHELITLGLRWRQLGTESLTWRDLKVIMNERPHTSAVTRATHPDAYLSDARRIEYLAYLISVGNVQRGNQSGARKGDFPKPPEWLDPTTQTIGSAPLPYDEMAAWLGGDFVTL